jgi:hypothetical protein
MLVLVLTLLCSFLQAVSPDGGLIASADRDYKLRVRPP